MNIEDYKKEVKAYSNERLENEYFALLDELSYDLVSFDWDNDSYNQYWQHDRPVFKEQLKVVENELSFRHINL